MRFKLPAFALFPALAVALSLLAGCGSTSRNSTWVTGGPVDPPAEGVYPDCRFGVDRESQAPACLKEANGRD